MLSSKDVGYEASVRKWCCVHFLLTSLSGTFALNVHMAPLSVFFKGASLLITAAAVVALEGLLYCEQEF